MHDFPLDIEDFDAIHLQHSPSLSSTFHALNSLSSHASVLNLTPSEVSFTWSSDDIPLVLYDDGYTHSPSSWDTTFGPSSPAAASPGTPRRSSVSNSEVGSPSVNSGFSPQVRSGPGYHQMVLRPTRDRTSDVPRSAAGSSLDLASSGLTSSDSSATVTSVGTFGQRKGLDGTVSSDASRNSDDIVDEDSVFRGQRSSAQHVPGLFARAHLTHGVKPPPLDLGSHISDGRAELLPSTATGSSEPQVILLTDDYEDDDDEVPETPTPMKPQAVPNSISWISSRNWNSQQYKEYVAREGLLRSPIPLSPVVPAVEEDGHPLRKTKQVLPRTPLGDHDTNASLETPKASRFAHGYVTQEHHVEGCKPVPVKPTIQQEHYTWLRDITVQFLIDQEGFRSARPSFKFTGVARLRSAHGTKAPGALMAQFRPVSRESFHFHYAPFESPPILRRVTVDFDEMHDYLTRQALISLKSNGVYVLHGHETSTINHDMEPLKLHWRFEYMVDDRRVEGTGRTMEGEKVMTPLTFSCTPALVLSSQGKSNTVMHVFKKGVAPKLVAEKMQPPGAAHPHTKSPIIQSATESHPSRFFSSKVHAWSLHKRVQSHSLKTQTEGDNHPRPHLPLPWTDRPGQPSRGQENLSPGSPHTRRRRASSAGENQRTPPFSPGSPAQHHHVTHNATPVSRRILSPAKLAEMLDAVVSPTVSAFSATSPKRSSTGFTPLTPRPHHPPHLKEPSYTR